ncbi:MAG TPA: FtsX-like permease family protein, partial [Acidimicrobiales bacterium]|nr:FtsX-like permease family protein [Acidimicrobiales bacterium]
TVVVHVLVAVLGAVATLAVAVAASRWFPIGLASKIDPDRGVHADWVALGPATVAVMAAVLGYAAAAGWRLTGSKRSQFVARRSTVATRLTPVAPLTVGLGTTMALRRGADRSSELVRPVLVGAVVGVLGVVATMTMNRGLDDALANPARAGATWDATAIPLPSDRTDTGINPARLESIGALPQVAGVAVVSRLVSEVNGAGVPVFSVQPDVGEVALTTTAGRAPAGGDEAAIGPRTADQLHVDIGDTVSVGSLHRQVRIVGQALFPADVHAGFDEGLWLTPNAFNSIEPPSAPDDPEGAFHMIAIRFRPGADPGAALSEVARAQNGSIADILPVEVPPELTNLRNVRTLPRLLATFLAVFAAAAVALVLGASVRRRRRDFATLRALGMTRGGTRAILNIQGTAIAVVGLVIGVPVGVALGRIAWQLVTERVPLDFVGPLALAAVVVIAVGALVVVNLLAVLPGRRAARLRPAEVLRAE